jgi:hypothetical protein
MQSTLLHAMPKQANSDNNPALNPNAEAFNKLANYNGTELLSTLVDKDFLNSHGVTMNAHNCQDNLVTKLVTCDLKKEGTKTVLFKQQKVNFEYLQSLVKDPQETAEILMDNNPALTEDSFTGEDSSFGQRVISLNEIDSNHAVVKFNYGYILNEVQNLYNVNTPVVFSSEIDDSLLTINKHNLLEFMHESFPSGIIFTNANNGQLQPIMFQPMSIDLGNESNKTIFDISIDRSGSMYPDFKTYQEKINELLEQVTKNTVNWNISITAFHTELSTQTYNSGEHNLGDLQNFVDTLEADYGTALYDTLHQRLNEAQQYDQKGNSILIIFTDGDDNSSDKSLSDINNLALDIRSSYPQFSMYTMGYGEGYTRKIFEDLSSNGGFNHLHLDRLDQIQEFNQYVETINNCKVVYAFEDGEAKFFEQCAAGDIAISSNLISYGSDITIAGEVYSVGLEQPQEA